MVLEYTWRYASNNLESGVEMKSLCRSIAVRLESISISTNLSVRFFGVDAPVS